ncbi:flagellar biosynthesis protein FlhF [Cohnella sp. GCM10027633]|uniref:flagellar biosynthesis protein FlhF n=1 Tax=unclassified Cohnella TaxID=2636738 RepID=UPI003643598D
MKVKRYIVEDLPEAVQQIRSDLGSDAVILNTKEIRVGGFLGMFRKKRMEVIAALDESAKKPADRRPSPPPRMPEREPAPIAAQQQESTAALATMLPPSAVRDRYAQKPFAEQARPSGSPQPASAAPSAFKDALNGVAAARPEPRPLPNPMPTLGEPSAPERHADAQANTLAVAARVLEERESKQKEPVTAAVSREPEASVEETSALLQELRSMKDMMLKLQKQQTYRSMPESVLKWSKRLAEQGVEPIYVEQFAEAVNERLGISNDDPAACYEAAKSVLREWLQPSRSYGLSPNARVVHFVGPTGVGKTTTIAKLAAEQSINYRRQVGFITADTYRIAAVDQLRTYADILNVPLEVVFSPSELTRAYKKLEDRDLVFMDTAGRNYRNELFVSEVNSLLAPGEESETVLVLSMTHKYTDMKLVASQFAKYGVDQLLLTKFDETDTFGSVLNLIKAFSFHISYITCGQTVPDDIRPYDPEDLVRRLLGDSAHE